MPLQTPFTADLSVQPALPVRSLQLFQIKAVQLAGFVMVLVEELVKIAWHLEIVLLLALFPGVAPSLAV